MVTGRAALSLVLVGLDGVAGETDVGIASSRNGLAYLGKFCFDHTRTHADREHPSADHSNMRFSLSLWRGPSSTAGPNLRLYLFDDEPESWPSVYRRGKSCAEVTAAAKPADSRKTSVRFGPDGRWTMHGVRIHESQRPRVWYVALADCSPGASFSGIRFRARFVNQGGEWRREFGVNEQGLNVISGAFLTAYLAMAAAHIYSFPEYRRRGAWHPLIRLFSASLFAQLARLLLLFCHTLIFTFDGMGIRPFRVAAGACALLSRLSLITMFILFAQGWATIRLSVESRSGLLTLLGAFVAAYLLLLLWDIRFRDPASTLYLYESAPGVLILALDAVAAVWFAAAMLRTLHSPKLEARKAALLRIMGVACMGYLVANPLVVATACLMPPWVREKTVFALDCAVTTAAHVGLLALLWPDRAAVFFAVKGPDVFEAGDKASDGDERERLL